jgi:hypothetical protein
MQLKNIKKISCQSKRYDIQTKNSNFFANNVLVHNSTLILSKYKNHIMARTRGTIDARSQANGFEIDEIFSKYPLLMEYLNKAPDTMDHSLLFEWVSPVNVIVLRYTEPDFILTNAVDHNTGRLFEQPSLDELAKILGMKRPHMFTFSKFSDLIVAVKEFKDKEGVCFYFNNYQNIVKIKGDFYLKIHKLKSQINNVENVIDLYLQAGQSDYNTFYKYVCDTLDFEIAQLIIGDISRLVDAQKEVSKIVKNMTSFAESCKSISRKEAAEKIISLYGNSKRSAFVFKLLDGKSLQPDDIKKLYFQVLK